jgi:hypothetical protein
LEPDVRECFLKGDGSEIPKRQGSIGKMQAVHSSSALGVNIFQYWKKIDQIPAIAAACGLCQKGNMSPEKIVFEDKYAIDKTRFRHPPNIDVVIYNSDAARFNCFAIESKFTEAYSPQGHQGIKKAYINLGRIWEDLPALYQMAISVCPDDHRFRHFHAAQLIKHILGLKAILGKEGFRLLYLWYDAFGEEGGNHRKEIEVFSQATRSDGIKFHALTYQDLITRLAEEYRAQHAEYIEYISGRYL